MPIRLSKNFISNNIDLYQYENSCLAVINNLEIPAWSISYRFSRGDFLNKHLIDHVISEQENNKRFQFFSLGPIDDIDQFSFLSTRYNSYLEHKVKKNTLTGYENIDHDVLEYVSTDRDRLIYLWVLKNEYRTF